MKRKLNPSNEWAIADFLEDLKESPECSLKSEQAGEFIQANQTQVGEYLEQLEQDGRSEYAKYCRQLVERYRHIRRKPYLDPRNFRNSFTYPTEHRILRTVGYVVSIITLAAFAYTMYKVYESGAGLMKEKVNTVEKFSSEEK